MSEGGDPGQLFLIDKPLGWTSFDVVKKVKYRLKIKKLGHAGTLDPLASGLLILCSGKLTKKIDEIQAQEKEYTGIIVLGKTTPSFDLETAFNGEFPFEHVTEDLLEKTLQKFRGEIQQAPPNYSAVKLEGTRAYDLARAGEMPEMKKRSTTVYTFEITKMELPELHFRIVCSKGTYIRSLAHDLGLALGSGAHLSKLIRTRIGNYLLENATSVEKLIGETE